MKDGRVRFGIVGCGWVAPAHAAAIALTPDADLVAVADLDRSAATEIADRFGPALVFSDYRQLLQHPDIDAVSICLPQHLHAEAACAAHQAGKHVLCEKPLAMTVDECDAMLESARRTGRALGIVFNYRYAEVARRALALLGANAIGTPNQVNARISMRVSDNFPPPRAWRESLATTSGGVLVHRVIHLLDFLILMLGEPRRVSALLTSASSDDLEDAAAIAFEFPNRTLGTLSVGTGAATLGTRIEVLGQLGMLVIEDARVLMNGIEQPTGPDIDVPPHLQDALLFGTGHVWAMRDFVAALVEGRAVPVDGRDGRRVQAVLESIYARSSRARAA